MELTKEEKEELISRTSNQIAVMTARNAYLSRA